jgi:hypothetical protein
MRNKETNLCWTALRAGTLAFGLVAFAGAGLAQSSKEMDKKPTAASHEKDDGLAKDAEGGGLKNNTGAMPKSTTSGSGAMNQQKGAANQKDIAKEEGNGAKDNLGAASKAKATTGSATMGSASKKDSAQDKKPTAASHEKDDGMAKDAEGGGLKTNR